MEFFGSTVECVRFEGLQGVHIAAGSIFAKIKFGIGITEYHFFRMYEKPYSVWKNFQRFHLIPFQVLKVVNTFTNDEETYSGKLADIEIMIATGVPTMAPEPVVSNKSFECSFPTLHDKFQIEEYLNGLGSCDLFLKPNQGAHGNGVFKLSVSTDSVSSDRIFALDDRRCSLGEVVETVQRDGNTLLVQKLYETHESLAKYGGEFGLSTFRVITAVVSLFIPALFSQRKPPLTLAHLPVWY